MTKRMTVAEVNARVDAIDNRISAIEKSNADILAILKEMSGKQSTPQKATTRQKAATPTADGVKTFTFGDGRQGATKGNLKVTETKVGKRTVYAVGPNGYKGHVNEKAKQAYADFCKGKKLTNLSFTDKRGKVVEYQRPIFKTMDAALAAIQ